MRHCPGSVCWTPGMFTIAETNIAAFYRTFDGGHTTRSSMFYSGSYEKSWWIRDFSDAWYKSSWDALFENDIFASFPRLITEHTFTSKTPTYRRMQGANWILEQSRYVPSWVVLSMPIWHQVKLRRRLYDYLGKSPLFIVYEDFRHSFWGDIN